MKSLIQRQWELFSAALEHAAGPEREAFLARECAEDLQLLSGVRNLLERHEEASSLLDGSVHPLGNGVSEVALIGEQPGDRIGRYRILEQIGVGGFGVVYMAEQEEPVRRRVALKVLRLGMDTKAVVARFEAERQALALMDHPNIAKVFDGGTTDSGRPYFVMELVRGIKITDYCDQQQSSVHARLKLFTQLCDAVQHAHQKGIIHRDLKPSNILVTINAGEPTPKVIDFGIAKATDQRLTDKTYFTQFHAFIGTPAYTSPEQAEMSSLDVDTRSDIYSLGVLLYELLTGQTPFPSERLLQSGLDEMRRIIREEDPPKPSTCLTRLQPAEATSVLLKRGAKGPVLLSAVRGDLDWIVMKALEKDRARRYATCLDFAADVERHLNHEAVLAGAPSYFYRMRKLLLRHKGAFAAAAALLFVLLPGLGVSSWEAVRASKAENAQRLSAEQSRNERDRALRAEAEARDIAVVATNALRSGNESLVKINDAEAWHLVESGDYFGALARFADSFALESDKTNRTRIHQMRLGSVLQQCPKIVSVWSAGTNIDYADFNRDGSYLATSSFLRDKGNNVLTRIWESTMGGLGIHLPNDNGLQCEMVAWSGDGFRFATVTKLLIPIVDNDNPKGPRILARGFQGGRCQIWDLKSGRPISSPIRIDDGVDGIDLNKEGTLFVTTRFTSFFKPLKGETETIRPEIVLWDVSKGAALWKRELFGEGSGNQSDGRFVAFFSPDGQYIMCAEGILDARTGVTIISRRLTGSGAFSPNGASIFLTQLSGGHSSSAELLEIADPSRIVHHWSSSKVPLFGTFSPDSKKLATANSDSTVLIWNTTDGSTTCSPMEHKGLASAITFNAAGKLVATALNKENDGSYVQLWDAETGKQIPPLLPHDSYIVALTFNKDDNRLIVVGKGGTVVVWGVENWRIPRFTWPGPKRSTNATRLYTESKLSSDGGILLYNGGDFVTRVRSTISGHAIVPPVMTAPGYLATDPRYLLAGSPSNCLVVECTKGTARIHDISKLIRTTNQIWAGQTIKRDIDPPTTFGRWIAAYQDEDTALHIVDMARGKLGAKLSLNELANKPERVLVSQDGQRVFAADQNGKTLYWNLGLSLAPKRFEFGKLKLDEYDEWGHDLILSASRGEPGWTNLVINPDTLERGIVTEDGWYLTQKESSPQKWWEFLGVSGSPVPHTTILSSQFGHRNSIRYRFVTHNQATVISAGTDLTLRFWDSESGEAVALPISIQSETREGLPSGDGRGFTTSHEDGSVRFWEMPKHKLSVAEWLDLSSFFEGKAREQYSALSPTGEHQITSGALGSEVTSKEQGSKSFLERWQTLHEKHPDIFGITEDEIDAWHWHEAWRFQTTDFYSNAVHHLSALLKKDASDGELLERRASVYFAWAESLRGGLNSSPNEAEGFLKLALADCNRVLEWVDRFPELKKEARRPLFEKRREISLRLGRISEAKLDEEELKAP